MNLWLMRVLLLSLSTDNRIGKLFSSLVISFPQVTTFNVEQLGVRPVGDREQK